MVCRGEDDTPFALRKGHSGGLHLPRSHAMAVQGLVGADSVPVKRCGSCKWPATGATFGHFSLSLFTAGVKKAKTVKMPQKSYILRSSGSRMESRAPERAGGWWAAPAPSAPLHRRRLADLQTLQGAARLPRRRCRPCRLQTLSAPTGRLCRLCRLCTLEAECLTQQG